ncbi:MULTISPECIES: amino acid ABC transporter substrate-binding protein [unclassified Acidovorax]|uniref:amino acid ABC transporter substrate-binding protein n=1 Tax=unclassified Acidovorax TaxID=2684926 RepID=UPI001C453625|nr:MULTISPECIES: amino acid ABC transporter substrate-binding protein [unclassified Acidovorax]MBV7431663.1 amino acid ABC transporter substrate-binding protein [Acidovorax sp. sif0732]MBV7452787.1 amino acid ABC transporter substrate-binding protein [Acidovorax sp. sif0715]
MKIATLTAAAALAALHISAPVHAQPTDTLQKIKSSGVIQLGGRDGSFPFSYKTSADSAPVGFSADLCMKVVDAVKAKLQMPDLKVQYTIVTPLNRIPLVQNGTIDLECSTTTNTAARAQLVQFAPTHFVGSIAVAVKSNSGINSLAELDGKAIATVSGSTSIQVMRAYRRNEKVEFSEVSGKDNSETFLMLSSGRAVAMILEDVQLAGLIARAGQPSDYKILSERLRDEPYGFMYRKDDPQFAALVDSTLTQVMKSGEIDKLYARWFTQPIAPTNVNLNFPMTDGVREAFRNPNKKPAL